MIVYKEVKYPCTEAIPKNLPEIFLTSEILELWPLAGLPEIEWQTTDVAQVFDSVM